MSFALIFSLIAFFYSTNAGLSKQQPILSSTQSVKCSICHLIVNYVENFIKRNESKAFIIKELDILCTKLPAGFNDECDTIVQNYAPRLIDWILNKENPDAFCENVHLCQPPQETVTKQTMKVHPTLTRRQQTIGCTICTTVALKVENWIAANETEEAIIDRLQRFCGALGPVAPECQSIVAEILPRLIKWIENKENPLVFCTQVGLCTSAVSQKSKKRDQEQSKCEVCQMIVTYVESLIGQNSTVAEIVAKVEDLCNLLPAPASSLCDQLAQQYVPQLVKWILNKENPQAFCAHFGLCE